MKDVEQFPRPESGSVEPVAADEFLSAFQGEGL